MSVSSSFPIQRSMLDVRCSMLDVYRVEDPPKSASPPKGSGGLAERTGMTVWLLCICLKFTDLERTMDSQVNYLTLLI